MWDKIYSGCDPGVTVVGIKIKYLRGEEKSFSLLQVTDEIFGELF
jgi:hypothetical protein